MWITATAGGLARFPGLPRRDLYQVGRRPVDVSQSISAMGGQRGSDGVVPATRIWVVLRGYPQSHELDTVGERSLAVGRRLLGHICPHQFDETSHRTVRLARHLTFRGVVSSYC